MVSQTKGKEMWQKVADADGWIHISKDPSVAIFELGISGYDEEKEAEQNLILASNYYDWEFKDETEEYWRFKD
jgi:hypothetical protein